MNFLKSAWNLFFNSNNKNLNKKIVSSKNTNDNKSMLNAPRMRLLLNDPTTPELTIDCNLVSKPKICPPFRVAGFAGAQDKMWTDHWRAAQAYCVFLNTLHTMQAAFKKPVSRWPAVKELIVVPKAGKDLNAFYDRRSLQFFYAADPKTKKTVYTVESTDIVSHELGHALLDSIRPDLWNLQALEVWSFHEAWADLVAVLTVMKYTSVIKDVLKETDGDLMKSSVITRLAEEVGATIFNYTGDKSRSVGSLRDANNNFVYVKPESLPSRAPNNKLAAECHSFGRVFLGAFYEIMTKIFQQEKTKGHESVEAMKITRSIGAKLLARAAGMAPASPRFYHSVARAMIDLDKAWGGEYQTILHQVFQNRKILNKRTVKALSMAGTKFSDLNISDNDTVEETENGFVVRMQSVKNMKLSDHFGVKAQGYNPLYDCEIELPNDNYLVYDKKGFLTDSLASSSQVAIDSARQCLKQIDEDQMWSPTPAKQDDFSKQFSIVENKLVRNFFN